METQVRVYHVKEGERRNNAVSGRDVLAHEGDDGFAAADARYYASEERAALDPDPRRLLEGTFQEQFMVRQVV